MIVTRLARVLFAATLALSTLLADQPRPALAESPRPAHVPDFSLSQIALKASDLSYNPTGEIIFPSIFHAGAHLADPLAEYYLYYAPHDAPGGISLAYSDSLDGPWTEHSDNPIINNKWSPHYNVKHVSSPHAVWIDSEMKLYFHGDNKVTRYAVSGDGLNFSYGGVAVTAADLGPQFKEASYARVFPSPCHAGDWVMVFMGNSGNDRSIYAATSPNGENWSVRQQPIVSPQLPSEGNVLGAPFLFQHGDATHIVHTTPPRTNGKLHYTEVGACFTEETHHGVFYADPGDRAAQPFIFESPEDGMLYLYYRRGARGAGDIALAKQILDPEVIQPVTSPAVDVVGSWTQSAGIERYGAYHLHDNNQGKGAKSVTFNLTALVTGNHRVSQWWIAGSGRASNVPVAIEHDGGVANVTVNQRVGGGEWNDLGEYHFTAGQVYSVTVSNGGTGTEHDDAEGGLLGQLPGSEDGEDLGGRVDAGAIRASCERQVAKECRPGPRNAYADSSSGQ